MNKEWKNFYNDPLKSDEQRSHTLIYVEDIGRGQERAHCSCWGISHPLSAGSSASWIAFHAAVVEKMEEQINAFAPRGER